MTSCRQCLTPGPTHECLMNDLVQAVPEPCSFCNDCVKSVKYFIIKCKDLMNVLNEVFKNEIGRNVFNMREMLTCTDTSVKGSAVSSRSRFV